MLHLLKLPDDQRQKALGILVNEEVRIVIRGVIARLLGVSFHSNRQGYENQEAEDVCSKAISAVLKKLSLFISSPQEFPIQNLNALASVIARRACADYLQQRYPEKSRLRDQLRYVLQNQTSFAFWKAENEIWLCGYQVWAGRGASSKASRQIEKLRQNPRALATVEVEPAEVHRVSLVRLVAAIFNLVGEPVAFNDLVKLIAAWRGIVDQVDQLAEEHLKVAAKGQRGAPSEVESRLFLRQLWREIETLPVAQRRALLLNLRYESDRGLLMALILLPVAPFDKVAQALGVNSEQLVKIVKTLPWDDSRIAEFLGLTRQQVINLRRSARRTLASRLGGKL